MSIFCNPINVPYRYSFKEDPRDHFRMTVNREAADPSMVYFKGRYWIFASMSGAVWVSDDMAHWESHDLPGNMPIYDYAPDVCAVGDWLYFTASNRGRSCDFYRTTDPLHGPYERISGHVETWDPDLFRDDDGSLYLYWGCSNAEPIRGVQLDPATLAPLREPAALITGNPWIRGYERFGEDHSEHPRTEAEIDALFADFMRRNGGKADKISASSWKILRAVFAGMPYIEGAWMTKWKGKYYLQYACPGAELNVYADGVYVSDHPLGPFVPARNNPFSYEPGGFMPGAGHGSTMEDREGMLWHTATMRISVNHVFERRVGVWPAGFDREGNLFCCQRYGDWPMDTERLRKDPFSAPRWMLLSYGKPAQSSADQICGRPAQSSADQSEDLRAEVSEAAGRFSRRTAGSESDRNEEVYEAAEQRADHAATCVTDENARTFWRAESAEPGRWVEVDLLHPCEIHAVQVNFADDPDPASLPTCPGSLVPGPDMKRYIDRAQQATRWRLEVSEDGEHYVTMEDKWETDTDLPHDLSVSESGIRGRYVRLTVREVPYGGVPCIMGLRIFGKGLPAGDGSQKLTGRLPVQPAFTAEREGDLDFIVQTKPSDDRTGINILWGYDEEHLYHSRIVYGSGGGQRIGALVKGQPCAVRVDAFNELGITEGRVVKL